MKRRSVLASAGFLAGGGLIIPSKTTGQTSQESWESFQSDPQNTGWTTTASGPTTDVGTAWRYGTRGEITGGAVIDSGRAYVPSRDGTLTAISLEDGSEIWSKNLGKPLDTTPAIIDGTIYVGGRKSTLYGVRDDGTVTLEYSLAQSDSKRMLSGTCSDGQSLYALIGEYDPVDGWNEGKLTAIDPNAGVEIWSEPLISSAPHTPAIDNETIYCFGVGEQDGANGAVLALSTADGDLEWAGGKNRGPGGITTSGNSVISTAGGTVTALSQSTGSTQWDVNFPDEDNLWANTSAAVADRSVYVAVQGGNEFGYLYDLDLVSGKINGRVEFYNPIQCSPGVTDDHIYVATDGGRVSAINRSELSKDWTLEVGSPVRAPPALVGNQLITGTTSGYAVMLRDNGKTPTSTSPTATPTSDRTETDSLTTQETESGQSVTTTKQSTTPTSKTSTRPNTNDQTPSRGFFTNSGNPTMSYLNDPFLLTVGGFMLSVIGILHQLLSGD